MKNTLKKGIFRTLIYKNKEDNLYYATILEFNLTLTSENKEVLILDIEQAARDYIDSANELKSIDILNQEPDPILEKMWNNLTLKQKIKIKSPYIPCMTLTNSINV